MSKKWFFKAPLNQKSEISPKTSKALLYEKHKKSKKVKKKSKKSRKN